jgi:hypothetical protein
MQSPEWLEEIAIPRLVGGIRRFPPPGEESDYRQLEEFIKSEFELRKKSGEKAHASAWLKVVCYHAIMAIWHNDGGEEDLQARIAEHKRLKKGPDRKGERTLFDEGLVALFASTPNFLSSTNRERMADPMWYAFRHYIPPALLIGFNHQYPGHRDRDRKGRWRQAIEPALESWIIQQRYLFGDWSFNLESLRGEYNDSIDDKVEDMVKYSKRSYNRTENNNSGGDEYDDWDEEDE